jgi:hypothetical protein
MYLFKKTHYSIPAMTVLMACMFLLTANKSISAGAKLVIAIRHYNGASLLKLESDQYKNALGQTYTISKFRYYISNICLKKSDGTMYFSKNYYLIDEEDASSKNITLTGIPEGDYNSISFMLGVDSLHTAAAHRVTRSTL